MKKGGNAAAPFHGPRPSERDPDAVAPIAAAFMLVPAIVVVGAPAPIVLMDDEADARIGIIVVDVPAFTPLVADDAGGRRTGHGDQRTGAEHRSQRRCLHGFLHGVSPDWNPSCAENTRRRDKVPAAA